MWQVLERLRGRLSYLVSFIEKVFPLASFRDSYLQFPRSALVAPGTMTLIFLAGFPSEAQVKTASGISWLTVPLASTDSSLDSWAALLICKTFFSKDLANSICSRHSTDLCWSCQNHRPQHKMGSKQKIWRSRRASITLLISSFLWRHRHGIYRKWSTVRDINGSEGVLPAP